MARNTQRRGHGEGTVYWDEGKRVWIAERELEGRRVRASGRDKTAARAALALRLRQLADGTLPSDHRVTVENAVRRFLERSLPNRRGGNLAPATLQAHAWACSLITLHLGRHRLDKLTTQNVEDFLDLLTTERKCNLPGLATTRVPMSRASLTKVRSTLAMVLDQSVKRRELVANVARLADLPPDARKTARKTALKPDEARRLLTALRHERNGLMFAFCLRLGLRPGESAGLYWSNLTGSYLTVSRTRRKEGTRVAVADGTKTAESQRTLEVPPDLVALLADHRRSQAAERLASTSWHSSELVFATPAGRVIDPTNERRHLAAVCKAAGVPLVTPNELRHSCASLLADEGVRNEDIADLLGHTTTRMVDQTYRHRLRSSVDVAARSTWATAQDA
jgi:integrase